MENNSLNKFMIKNYAYELNRHFNNNIVACYVKNSKINMQNFDIKLAQKILGKTSLVLSIQDSYLIIFSFEKNEKIDIENTLNILGLRAENYNIGISNTYKELGLFDQILFEAKTALKVACYKGVYISKFNEIGIYKLLFPLFDNYYAIKYYDEIVRILLDHDDIYKSNLLETACAYIKSDGDIKETSILMFQHTNTIRYRIRKIKFILEFDKIRGMQYETLAIAIHLYELNKKRYTFNLL